MEIGTLCTNNTAWEKFLGINFDDNVKFTNHIDNICKKASWKSNALARIGPYMSTRKRRTLMNLFFKSPLNYCSLIWMRYSWSLNNKTDRLHEQCLQILYNDKTSDFDELLEKDSSVSIHYQNANNWQLKYLRNQQVYVLRLWKDSFNLETKYFAV